MFGKLDPLSSDDVDDVDGCCCDVDGCWDVDGNCDVEGCCDVELVDWLVVVIGRLGAVPLRFFSTKSTVA